MASKMPAARDAGNVLIGIPAAQQNKYIKPLRCEFCEAHVSFVNGFTRSLGEDVVVVDPFFRLIKGQLHSDSCTYNVRGQVSIIARESDGDNRLQMGSDMAAGDRCLQVTLNSLNPVMGLLN